MSARRRSERRRRRRFRARACARGTCRTDRVRRRRRMRRCRRAGRCRSRRSRPRRPRRAGRTRSRRDRRARARREDRRTSRRCRRYGSSRQRSRSGRVDRRPEEGGGPPMKICCSSRSYARALQSGDLTQLEWVDRCARLALDGVDLASAHFPRTDLDYLAQIRKLCVDRGLTVAGVTLDGDIGGDIDVDAQTSLVGAWVDNAAALGAPLMRLACGSSTGSPGIAWRELIRELKAIAHAAKEKNVTIALEPRARSLVASPADCKRALKECDSAWLRLAQDVT